MSFKSWILAENIIVKYGKDEASLVPATTNILPYDFHYQSENDYATYFIGFYRAERTGYVSLGSQPTHIGIIKTNSINHGNAVDIGFIKNLIGELSKMGFKSVPYKEVGTNFDKAFSNVGYKPENPAQTGYTTGENIPDIDLGQSSTHSMSPGISVSRAAGSWAYFIEVGTGSSQFYLSKLINAIKQAAQPLVNNDLIDFYSFHNRTSGKDEIVYSSKGKESKENYSTQLSQCMSQLKYMASVMQKEMPSYIKQLLNRINLEGAKNAENWTGRLAEPKNYKLKFSKMYELIQSSLGDDIIIKSFLDAMKLQDTERFNQLEKIAKWSENKDSNRSWIGGALENIEKFWGNDESKLVRAYSDPEKVFLYISSLYETLVVYGDLLKEIEPDEYDHLVQTAKYSIEKGFEEGHARGLSRHEIVRLNDLADVLDLNPKIKHELEQNSQELKDQEEKRQNKMKEERLSQRFLIPEGQFSYLEKDVWKTIPDKFLEYYNGKYEINFGELALDFIDDDTKESISHDAYEKAEEEAHGDVSERPSETYGQDKKELFDDIDYYWDKFIEDYELDDINEDTPEQEIPEIIKKHYVDDFIDWRKEKMQEDEDSDGRYTPDTESHEFQMRIHEIEKELAEEKAWEQGLATIYNDDGDIFIQTHKNNYEKIKSIIKKTIELNLSKKDNDGIPYWKSSTPINIDFIPQGGFRKSAYDMLNM